MCVRLNTITRYQIVSGEHLPLEACSLIPGEDLFLAYGPVLYTIFFGILGGGVVDEAGSSFSLEVRDEGAEGV